MLFHYTRFVLLLLLFRSITAFSQPVITPVLATEMMKREQAAFLEDIDYLMIDSHIVERIYRFLRVEADSICQSVISDSLLDDAARSKAIQSLFFFIKELDLSLSGGKFEIYDVPDAIDSYKAVLNAFLTGGAYIPLLRPLGPRRSQLLAATFWQYDGCAAIEEVAVYKRVATSPEFVLQFLESRPGFRFADSLLLVAAAHTPFKIISLLRRDSSALTDKIRHHPNRYVRQLVLLSTERELDALVPFMVPLAEKRIRFSEILERRKDPDSYFQLLVSTLLMEKGGYADTTLLFLQPLRQAIREHALSFYVKQLNDLHSSTPDIRFASVARLRAEDLYFIIISSEEELYTSSYLGLYQRLMDYFPSSAADSLIKTVKYEHFRPFIRMAANYNTLADFLNRMSRENATQLMRQMVSGIETDTYTGLAKAMVVADSYMGFGSVPGLYQLVEDELHSNQLRCRKEKQYYGIRLYSILLQVFGLVKNKDSLHALWTRLGNQELLEVKDLVNARKQIIEVVLFYGDEDGQNSYRHFLNLFKDSRKWNVSGNAHWTTIRSLTDTPLVIFANLPLDNQKNLDTEAQDSLFAFLQREGMVPAILIHRGHSYHLPHTLQRLDSSVKLIILGSCGGYKSILAITNSSHRAQIIISKKTGSVYINDALTETINNALKDKKDLVWLNIWEKLEIRFRKNEFLANLFNEYIPPARNISLFVYKLFKDAG